MSKKTYAIVSGIVGAVATCANTIIALFNLPKEALIIAAVGAVATCATTVLACFVDNTKQIEK